MGDIRRYIIGALLLLPATVGLFGSNDRTLFSPESEVYELLRAVRLEAGRSIPWSSRSLTASDIRRQLDDIDRGELSNAGRQAIAEIEKLIEPVAVYESAEEEFAFDLSPSVALEAYLNAADSADEWQYAYGERNPLIALPGQLWLGDSLYGRVDLDLQQEKFATLDPRLSSNAPRSLDEIDYMVPYRGYVLAAGNQWFLQTGRDRLRWGSGRSGVMVLSDEPTYYDFVRFGFGVDRFRYTSLITHIEPRFDPAADGEWEQIRTPPSGSFDEETDEDDALERFSDRLEDPALEPAKTMYLHRFEFDLFERLQLALVEGMMLGERRGDLRFWNPLSIYHNFFEVNLASALLGLEVNWNPWRNLNIYGEYAMNQIGTEFKPDDIPNALGGLAGVEGQLPVDAGYLTGYGEFVYTNPWLGVREHPWTSWHWRRRIVSNVESGRPVVTEPIGYRFGPDSVVMATGLGYTVPGRSNINLDLTYLRRGEQRINSPYEDSERAVSLRTPSGVVERSWIAELGGSRALETEMIGADITLGFNAALVSIANYRNVSGREFFDVQFSPSLVLHF
ncbi:MAG: hypothetical protein ACLFM0_06610 [Spirochaetales bacterium]